MTQNSEGLKFERQVLKTLKGMGITCYGEHGQIQLQTFYPRSQSRDHLEIDIVCLIENICILVETTTQTNNNSNKIKKFIRHCELIVESPLPKDELFSHFAGIPNDELINFTGISQWHYLYIGTSSELITENIIRDKFPDTDRLQIFNEENWEYFKILERSIGKVSKYEFLASVEIKPSDLGDPCLGENELQKPYLKLSNKILFSDQVHADLYIVIFTPDELLRIARVLRYKGQPIEISSGTSSDNQSSGYQRILLPEKLRSISKFVDDNSKIAFPTNLTLIISNECVEREGLLCIPSKYASIDVIDGQHRLFSYALANDEVQKQANLITTVIKFHTDNQKVKEKCAAQTFITINREQTKVKKDLLYLISYDVLGEKTPESIAAKILKECDSRDCLSSIFALSPLIKKNRFEQTPIPIISIVNELAKIFLEDKLDKILYSIGRQTDDASDSEVLINAGVELLEKYFYHIIGIYSDDWGNVDSLLMCANYIGAFIRLLGTFIDKGFTMSEICQELLQIKENVIERYSEGKPDECTTVFFSNAFKPSQNGEDTEELETIPSKRDGTPRIYSFLNGNRN